MRVRKQDCSITSQISRTTGSGKSFYSTFYVKVNGRVWCDILVF